MKSLTDLASRRRFISEHASFDHPPLTPEIGLWLAEEATTLWQASETFLEEAGLPPPFWAFAWAGGQALARFVLDSPEAVAGKRVLDFGSGCGLVAIAALRSGASSVLAADLDPFAAVAVRLNGEVNGCAPEPFCGDATALAPGDFDIILAADVCYEREPSESAFAWLRSAVAAGVEVLVGDPGRTYLDQQGLRPLAGYDVPTSTELEKSAMTQAKVWRLESVTNPD